MKMYLVIFMLILVAFFFTREGMQCYSFVRSFQKAKDMEPKPFCANGFPLDPNTECATFNTECEFGFHKVSFSG
jgi:hypothetical protein